MEVVDCWKEEEILYFEDDITSGNIPLNEIKQIKVCG
jgi:hypothetical protein